jgi:hypothetical protein
MPNTSPNEFLEIIGFKDIDENNKPLLLDVALIDGFRMGPLIKFNWLKVISINMCNLAKIEGLDAMADCEEL